MTDISVIDRGAVQTLLCAIRRQASLVHRITNWVTVADCAQITRSVGALPVMAHMAEEVAEMVRLAGALVLNIGTLDRAVLESMQIAGRKANALGIPVVLDIVGCGATAARSAAVKELSAGLQLAVIKSNIGEIGAGGGRTGRGPHGLQERAFRQRLRLGPSRANARRPGPGRPEKEG